MTTPPSVPGRFLTEPTRPDAIFTPEDLTEEQQEIARTVDRFWTAEVEPALPAIHRKEPGAARRVMQKAAELGLMAIAIPERYGGMELDLISTLVIAEHVARDASYMVWDGGHTLLGTLPLVYFGTDEQKQRYLPRMATLELLGAYALSEAGAGSDALAVRTRADLAPDGAHYVLNGQKMWITNASDADLFIVFAKVAGEAFTCFLVERGFPGVSTGAEEQKMGLEGSSTRALYLDDVPVPAANVLGEVGRGHIVAFNILNLGRLKLGASTVGAARDVLACSIAYARNRQAFGRPIAEFGAIQEKLARMAVGIFATESITWRTAGLIEQHGGTVGWDEPDAARRRLEAVRSFAMECSMVKVSGSEMLDLVVDEAVQIHGGYGYHADYAVERAYRDARINRIFEGTNEINRLLIPRILLKFYRERGVPRPAAATHAPASGWEGTVARARAVALDMLALAGGRFPGTLDEEQELAMSLADILIDTYVMESAWLRGVKIAASSPDTVAADMVTRILSDAMVRIRDAARRIICRAVDGAARGERLGQIEDATALDPVDAIALDRTIAAHLIDCGRYAL